MIKVLKDNVLVTDVKDMQVMIGGIHLPDFMRQYGGDETASERRYACNLGTIVDFGPDAENIKRGQECYLAPMKGKHFVSNGKMFSIYKYEEVFGVIG